MTDQDPLGDLMGKPIHAFGYPTPDKHPGYNPVRNEQSVRITRIFQPITIDLRGTDGRKWHGVVERVTLDKETGRVTLELWSQEEFQQVYAAMRRTAEEAGEQ